jgi:hypothetical protein
VPRLTSLVKPGCMLPENIKIKVACYSQIKFGHSVDELAVSFGDQSQNLCVCFCFND